MKTMKLATSAFALGALALSASADTETTLWSVNFNGMTAAWDVPNQESETDWTISGAGTFTRTQDDNSKVVGTYKEVSLSSDALELNTEGNELVFAPATSPSGDKTVVDADIYFIASDTNPNITEGSNPVQAALYLYADENATPELRAYTYTDGGNVWTNLDYTITDNVSTGIWLHVSIAYDGTDVTYTIGEGANQTSTTLLRANNDLSGSFHEVVFKGTGLVDNFTGKSVTVDIVSYDYTAQVVSGTVTVSDPTVDGSTASFQIPLEDDNGNPLSSIEVMGTNGVAHTYAVAVTYDDQDPPWPVSATLTEGGSSTVLNDGADFDVDIQEFLDSGEPDGTEFTVLKLYYTAAGGEETWGDDPVKDQTQLDSELADGFANLDADDVPVTFDAQDGFTVKFIPTTPGRYSLVAVESLDDDFDTDTGDGIEVDFVNVDATFLLSGDPVELNDDTVTGANAPAARFYKIKVGGAKE